MVIRIKTSADAEKFCIVISGNLQIQPQRGGAVTRFRYGNSNNDVNHPYADTMALFEKWFNSSDGEDYNHQKMLTIKETS